MQDNNAAAQEEEQAAQGTRFMAFLWSVSRTIRGKGKLEGGLARWLRGKQIIQETTEPFMRGMARTGAR